MIAAALPGSTVGASAAPAIVESALPAPQEKSASAVRRYDSCAPPAVL